MTIDDALIKQTNDGKDILVEIDIEQLKKWFEQEELDLLDFESKMDKKIAVYNILEEKFGNEDYNNFTVKFI